MIDIKTKIHDKFSIEFKVGFVGKRKIKRNYFSINSWIFVPNSLDINPSTYGKEQFYRDVKSNVRLITPVFLLRDIASGEAIPLNKLEKALHDVASSPTSTNIANYEYHIKMFAAIFKSSLRDESLYIVQCKSVKDTIFLCENYIKNVREIIGIYRDLEKIINVPTMTALLRNYFSFGDEFMSYLIKLYSYKIVEKTESCNSEELREIGRSVLELIKDERDYQTDRGYVQVSKEDNSINRRVAFRYGILKKYIESDLYIRLNKKQDGKAVKEMYYSLAAGIAMIFATVIAFAFQRKFGNFSTPLFIALVISYMGKDRIKELTRYYFVHKLRKKYFDNKAVIKIKDREVGWIKEGVDFITDEKTPKEVLELRNRSALLEAENKIFDEKILLYRKLVYINNDELSKNYDYHISGINDIIRLHITRFTQKMDDPEVKLRTVSDDDKIEVLVTDKIYYINIVLQFDYMDDVEYRHFRITASREGILEIEEDR